MSRLHKIKLKIKKLRYKNSTKVHRRTDDKIIHITDCNSYGWKFFSSIKKDTNNQHVQLIEKRVASPWPFFFFFNGIRFSLSTQELTLYTIYGWKNK